MPQHTDIHTGVFYRRLLACVALALMFVSNAQAQTTQFTYQGRLTDSGNPADGPYDMQFKLFDTAEVGTGIQLGPTITSAAVEVENGVFAVGLDFTPCSDCFDGSARFLEVSIRPAGSVGPRTVLSPRQAITSAPYALRALDATQLGGIAASGFIQNTTMPQGGTNFNIAGDGMLGGTLSAGVVNTAGRYEIGGSPVLSVSGPGNLFVGLGAGANNTDGNGNSFFGSNAGLANQAGGSNSFFGSHAGQSNQSGNLNAFFGARAGLLNTASFNSFFGARAGDSNTTGDNNAFFGNDAGQANQTGSNNAFFGFSAGFLNTASFNSFFGADAGLFNISGSFNSFFGNAAGRSNTVACCNSFFGANAGFSNTDGVDNSFFGTDSGHDNMSGTSNAFFGRSTGFANAAGNGNSFFGRNAGRFNVSGNNNSFFGRDAGFANLADNNSFFGVVAGNSNTTGSNNTIIGATADVGTNNLTFATAIGAGAVVSNSDSVVLGRAADTVRIPGALVISTLGAATATQLCHDGGLVSNCSSSLRYKDRLAPFTSGLELINRLRPITFSWKRSGERDLGFAAEEVAEVEPLLVTFNERGQVEGVKYDRITVALVNAIREQQAQIALLKKIVCLDHPDQDLCRSAK